MKKLIFSDSIVNFIAAKASDPSFLRQLTSKQEINERCSKLKQSVEKVKRVLSQTKTTCN